MAKTPAGSRLKVPAERAIERCAVYVDGNPLKGPFTYRSALEEVRRRGTGFVWLGLLEPDEQQMVDIARAYEVHELIVEDAVAAHQRPKLERYGDQLFFVVRSVFYNGHDSMKDAREIIETGEVQMIMGPDFIITVRHSQRSTISGLRKRIDEAPDDIALGPQSVAWYIADSIVDDYLRIVAELADDVDQLENQVFTPDSRFEIEHIYMLKREILEMRHSIDPLVPALKVLVSNMDLVSKPIRSYFRDVLDHELVAVDMTASYDERLSALIDAGAAKISLQQNSDMRKISAWVGMAALPTMVAGIYGMNFDNMPELHTQYGYFVVLAIMGVLTAFMYWQLHRNNWL